MVEEPFMKAYRDVQVLAREGKHREHAMKPRFGLLPIATTMGFEHANEEARHGRRHDCGNSSIEGLDQLVRRPAPCNMKSAPRSLDYSRVLWAGRHHLDFQTTERLEALKELDDEAHIQPIPVPIKVLHHKDGHSD